MNKSELIIYIEKNKKGKYTCILTNIFILKKIVINGEVKILYYEIFKNSRSAKSRLKRMQSLSNLKLVELIKDSNPEMLNLINCI